MRLLISTFFLLLALSGTCQLRCVDVVERLEPEPYELLNDSIANFATPEQIDDLIDEQNLLFSYNFNLRTLKINHLQMDYFEVGFEVGFLDGAEPLNPELIKKLELFFKRNLKVIVKPEHSNSELDITIECAFLTRIETE